MERFLNMEKISLFLGDFAFFLMGLTFILGWKKFADPIISQNPRENSKYLKFLKYGFIFMGVVFLSGSITSFLANLREIIK